MLEKVKSSKESVLWYDKTNRFLYTMVSPILLIFAIIWGGIDVGIYFFTRNIDTVAGTVTQNGVTTPAVFSANPFIIGFLILHSIPFWGTFVFMLIRYFASKNVEYMMTDLRIYLVSGLFGKDVTNIEYREIKNLTVNVSPLENMLGLGTIILTPDAVNSDGSVSRRGIRMKHIKNPYEIYKRIKELSLDVTTDQYYPNALRPSENPGYATKYKG